MEGGLFLFNALKLSSYGLGKSCKRIHIGNVVKSNPPSLHSFFSLGP